MSDKTKASDKRAIIREKVAASQADLAAGHPRENFAPEERVTGATMGHPFVLVLGGMALGAVAGALLPRSVGRRMSKRAIAVATIAGELGLAYGRRALEKTSKAAHEGRQTLGTLGETVSDEIVLYGKKAASVIDVEPVRDTGMKLAQKVRKLASQLRH